MVRLSRLDAVTIASIRGRASGIGSELALAVDMRFASREKAILSQFEVGAGFVPGGGPMARLPRLLRRGRAMEILLGGDDFDGELAERYGYVNRALPDAELDSFVMLWHLASRHSIDRPSSTSRSWSTSLACRRTRKCSLAGTRLLVRPAARCAGAAEDAR